MSVFAPSLAESSTRKVPARVGVPLTRPVAGVEPRGPAGRPEAPKVTAPAAFSDEPGVAVGRADLAVVQEVRQEAEVGAAGRMTIGSTVTTLLSSPKS